MAHTGKPYDLVGIGRSYIDIIAEVDYDFLEKHNIPLGTGDYHTAETIDQIVSQLNDAHYYPGGAIPNTVAGFSALGGRCAYMGKVAGDKAGTVFLQDMNARGIDDLSNDAEKQTVASGVCVVLVTPEGERSFALHKGCVDCWTQDNFDSFDFNDAAYTLIGANLISGRDVSDLFRQAVAKIAKSSTKLVITMSEIRDWEGNPSLANDIVKPYADIIIGNEAENASLLDLVGPLDRKDQILVTTLGNKGAIAQRSGETVHVNAVKQERSISSLGAGDQFLAGFVKGDAMGLSLHDSLQLATLCAVRILERKEARPLAEEDWSDLISSVTTPITK
ncbi:MAG: adenosine kinase [Proteobacteria bacterium]|nr:adenosine kinase [Pseudomonadota bacterium]